jgi:hypothetical protein
LPDVYGISTNFHPSAWVAAFVPGTYWRHAGMLQAANARVLPVGGRFERGVTTAMCVGGAVIVGAPDCVAGVLVGAAAPPLLEAVVELLLELPQAAIAKLADASPARSEILYLCTKAPPPLN